MSAPVVDPCVFCEIATGDAPATVVAEWDDALAIVPRGPATDGHVLVIPRRHVPDATAVSDVTASAMRRAVEVAATAAPCNLITSVGAEATQTVYHLHIHVVPRRAGDGLALPWTNREAV